MRTLSFIVLTISLMLTPVVATGSCASMAKENPVASGMAIAGSSGAGVMANKDFDCRDADHSRSHDAGCPAACALACPAVYVGPDGALAHAPVFELTHYPILATGPGVATPSYLDPPPPRF